MKMTGQVSWDQDPRLHPDSPEARPWTAKGLRARRRILEAARKCFAEVGYEKATLRMIAAEADSDKSSIVKYFGNKDQLFRESVYWTIPIDDLTADTPDGSAENYLRAMLSAWAKDPHSPMAVLLRASMTSEDAAELLRSHITTNSVERVLRYMEGPDAELRASLFAAMMMGIASGRYLLRIPGLAEADLDDVLRAAAPSIRALISEDADEEERDPNDGTGRPLPRRRHGNGEEGA